MIDVGTDVYTGIRQLLKRSEQDGVISLCMSVLNYQYSANRHHH